MHYTELLFLAANGSGHQKKRKTLMFRIFKAVFSAICDPFMNKGGQKIATAELASTLSFLMGTRERGDHNPDDVRKMAQDTLNMVEGVKAPSHHVVRELRRIARKGVLPPVLPVADDRHRIWADQIRQICSQI